MSSQNRQLKPIRIQAGWVITLRGEPIRGGCLLIHQGLIVAIEKRPEGSVDCSWPDEIVLPGLINAHTHLEFSGLQNPFSPEGGFTKWVERVLEYRRQQGEGEVLSRNRERFCLAGLEEAGRTATVWLADIATAPYELRLGGHIGQSHGREAAKLSEVLQNNCETLSQSSLPQQRSELGVIALGEMIGWAKSRQESSRQWYAEMKQHAESSDSTDRINYRWGISPHAPYSTSPELIQWCVEQSASSGSLLAMHLAETEEEMAWIEARKGPLAELLNSFGVDTQDALYRWQSASDYLSCLQRAARSLVIHGNYLSAENWDFLAAQRDRMSVVYCPRTHRYFGHRSYPLEKMLARGVRVCVGTDSRASSPNLNLWEELQEIRDQFRGIHPETILRLATVQGAEALGIQGFRGYLEVGGWALFAVARMRAVQGSEVSVTTVDRLWESLLDRNQVASPTNPFLTEHFS